MRLNVVSTTTLGKRSNFELVDQTPRVLAYTGGSAQVRCYLLLNCVVRGTIKLRLQYVELC